MWVNHYLPCIINTTPLTVFFNGRQTFLESPCFIILRFNHHLPCFVDIAPIPVFFYYGQAFRKKICIIKMWLKHHITHLVDVAYLIFHKQHPTIINKGFLILRFNQHIPRMINTAPFPVFFNHGNAFFENRCSIKLRFYHHLTSIVDITPLKIYFNRSQAFRKIRYIIKLWLNHYFPCFVDIAPFPVYFDWYQAFSKEGKCIIKLRFYDNLSGSIHKTTLVVFPYKEQCTVIRCVRIASRKR